MGHLNCISLDLLKKMDDNGVSFYGTVPLQHGRQLCLWRFPGDLHRPDGKRHARGARGLQICLQDLRRASHDQIIYPLRSKDGTLPAFQSFVQSMVTPSEVCVERLTANKECKLIGNDIKDYFSKTAVLLGRASANTPP